MRSGISHLKKKMGNEDGETYLSLADAAAALGIEEERADAVSGCELDAPMWSVVSFDQREAGGLTFAQAFHLIAELDALGVAGLCIVTDAAAERTRR